MHIWNLLLIALLQSPTDAVNSPAAIRDQPSGIQSEIVPLEELRNRVADGEFVPVPRSLLQPQLSEPQRPAIPDEVFKRSQIREARYAATLTGTNLRSGTLELNLYSGATQQSAGPLLIGTTSLQQLKLSDDQGPVALGSDASRRLFVLRPGLPKKFSGTWAAEGLVAGEVVTFRLELPPATLSRFELITPPQIQVTSAGSLVLGPELKDGVLKWELIPGDSSRLAFSCRTEADMSIQGPLPLTGFTASHTVEGDTLASRWTIGLPSTMRRRTTMIARVPEKTRVTEVMLEDRRPVEWSLSQENHQQLLKMVVPVSTPGTSLQVSATSVLPQAETWNLPMLSPAHWQSEDEKHRGLILVPVSQITVLLPASVELEEWTLVGIQERDVVTRPDESREYQLTQFLPEASAVVRTSTSQPRISDAVVTLLEPAGRLAAVRCLVNVRCEGAAVVELKWPVAAGWQVIAARYASNLRALFFEFPEAGPEAPFATLTVHLPEALEPGSSQVLELQLQQTDSSDPATLNLPLMVSPSSVRTHSIVMFPPATSLKSDAQRRWSVGRRLMTKEEIRRQAAWFPETRLEAGMQAFEAGEIATLPAKAVVTEQATESASIQLEHAVRIVDGLIVENSRLLIPFQADAAKPLIVATPLGAGSDLRWSVDGESVVAKRLEASTASSSEPSPEWRSWIIPVANRQPGTPVIIRLESLRSVSPDFLATIPMPQIGLPIQGTLQLFSSDEGLLSTEQLVQESVIAESRSTILRLPAESNLVQVKVDQNPRIQSGQTIEVHMLHLIGEQNGGLQRDVLAVANVSRSAGKNVLPLSLPGNTRPLVLVNGHRVQLQETDSGFGIPLPPSSADCQVLLTWTEPGQPRDRVTGVRQLPRLFLSEVAVPQCTHHILVDPSLELHAPFSPFVAAEPTEIARVLDRLLTNSANNGSITQGPDTKSIPAEVRQFVIRWQLAAVQGWQPQTLIDTVMSDAPLVIQVTQMRRRRAIMAGSFLIFIAACIGFRQFANQHRLASATMTIIILAASYALPSQILTAAMTGAFWGLSLGLLLVIIARWRKLKVIGKNPFFRSVTSSLIWLLLCNSGIAAPQNAPDNPAIPRVTTSEGTQPADVLIPEFQVLGNDVIYVRRSLLETWRKRNLNQTLLAPLAVITSLKSRIIAESIDSIDLRLTLEVAAVSSDKAVGFRIPLQSSRLVECYVDGVKVLPEPDGAGSIRVELPASTLVPQRLLMDHESPAASESTAIPLSADAGSRAAFTLHTVECRLRPMTSRQASGVQFRLPGLPCADTSVEVVAPEGLFSGARAQTPEGVVEWKPSDGSIPLSSLAMADGIDIRLFQASIEKGSPQLATVQILAINETISGQQVLTCVCRFSRWNKLTPDVRYRVPQGYRLASVSATTGADVVTDLLWSVKDQNAQVQLPAGIGNEFVLSIQLVCLTPATVQNQPVPVAELQQFADCIAAPSLLLAVRANSVFSVLPLEGTQVSTMMFADLQADWGQWLRRSDIIFRVPSVNAVCTIRLAPRSSVNEVRISQNISIQEGQIDWKCQIDIETTVLPVFRHRLKINSEIVITDVQVVAGEANRLDSWHRRGDQLVIQLKEGTTGLHKITIDGRQILRPDDATVTLHSPHLQNTEIPETSMTLVDQDGLGLTFVRLGGAKPDERIKPNDLLPPGKPIRMQIINEEDPIVLQRIRPVDPIAAVAAVRSVDQVTFVLHISQWSGSLGPLHMNFPETTEFLQEPIVIAEGLRLPLVREATEFVADQNVVKSLFDRPEFTVVWKMRIRETDVSGDAATFGWPQIFDGIQWSELLLVPLDAEAASPELAAATTVIPEWLKDAGLSAEEESGMRQTGAISLPLASALKEGQLSLPVRSVTDRSAVETGRDIVAVADSIVWCSHGQSAVGETLLILFAARTPSKCSVRIPDGIVITELQADEPTRWEDATRKNFVVELNGPVTVVRTRWLSQRAANKAMSTQLDLLPPYPADCGTRRTLTVVSENAEPPSFPDASQVLSPTDLLSANGADINVGLNHARPADSAPSGNVLESLPSQESLVQIMAESRAGFLMGFQTAGQIGQAAASCRSTDSRPIVVLIARRLDASSILSLITAVLVMTAATFARNMGSSTTPVPVDPGVSHSKSVNPRPSGSGSQNGKTSAVRSEASAQTKSPSAVQEVPSSSSSINRPPQNQA